MRYTFRTAPLRNLKVAPAFFHNGAFGRLEAAIAHHLDVEASLRNYDPDANKVPLDLSPGPFDGILAAGIDPLLKDPVRLTKKEFGDLVEFVRDGLFDKRVLSFASTSRNRCRAVWRFSSSRGVSNSAYQGAEPIVLQRLQRYGSWARLILGVNPDIELFSPTTSSHKTRLLRCSIQSYVEISLSPSMNLVLLLP